MYVTLLALRKCCASISLSSDISFSSARKFPGFPGWSSLSLSPRRALAMSCSSFRFSLIRFSLSLGNHWMVAVGFSIVSQKALVATIASLWYCFSACATMTLVYRTHLLKGIVTRVPLFERSSSEKFTWHAKSIIYTRAVFKPRAISCVFHAEGAVAAIIIGFRKLVVKRKERHA